MKWIHGCASVVGQSHVETNTPCQDYCKTEELRAKGGETIFLAAASDGAGSAKHSDKGSMIVVESFFELARDAFLISRDIDPIVFFPRWLETCRQVIATEAQIDLADFRDYAATALLAIVWKDKAAFFQLGDGCIVVDVSNDNPSKLTPSWVFWGDKLSEEVNVTTFVTSDDGWLQSNCSVFPISVTSLAMFTDGIEHGVLDIRTQSPHYRFFEKCFLPLRSLATNSGIREGITEILMSDAIASFSDDDKTLILAIRKESTDAGEPPWKKSCT